VWESGGVEYGLVPNGGTSDSGQLLSGFASLVESTLGSREGAVAMTLMASPNAYLAIEQATVTGATATGTDTIDGVSVTTYAVQVDVHQLVDVPGLSADEVVTIKDALGVLDHEGYQATNDTISVDADGFIRRVVAVSSFEDGATVTHETTNSNFGCAGTVLTPGQSHTTEPPAACPAGGTATTTQVPSTSPTTTAGTSPTEPTTTDTTAADAPSTVTTSADPGTTDPGTSGLTTTMPPPG
jgi:hypothetical protein